MFCFFVILCISIEYKGEDIRNRVYVNNGDTVFISVCEFSWFSSSLGGCIQIDKGHIVLEYSTVRNSVSTTGGGAIYIKVGNFDCFGCSFYNCSTKNTDGDSPSIGGNVILTDKGNVSAESISMLLCGPSTSVSGDGVFHHHYGQCNYAYLNGSKSNGRLGGSCGGFHYTTSLSSMRFSIHVNSADYCLHDIWGGTFNIINNVYFNHTALTNAFFYINKATLKVENTCMVNNRFENPFSNVVYSPYTLTIINCYGTVNHANVNQIIMCTYFPMPQPSNPNTIMYSSKRFSFFVFILPYLNV